jgi:hypothetical protein
MADDAEILIPKPDVIRQRLAKVVRERTVLEKLLKLSVQAEEDRHFVRSLRSAETPERPDGGGQRCA